MNEDVRVTELPKLSLTKLHIAHSFVWTHIFPESAQVPKTRSKHATCHHAGSIYLYGGVCGNVALKDMWRFEPDTSLWTKLECRGDTPPLLQEHTMVGYKELILIFGGLCGFDNPGETSLWILDLSKFIWEKQVIRSEVMTPTSRRGHSAVCHDGGMHLFGGHIDLKGSSNELWTLDFETLYWHTMVYSKDEPIPPPRHGHSAVMHDEDMYIYGGSNNLQLLKDMWKWNFRTRQWSKVRFWQGPPALHGHSALSLGDSMMLYGGEDSAGAFRSDLWIFSYSSESWAKVPYKGSIIPSPTIHQTLEMDIPQSGALYAPQDERSLSAPFLQGQRPSVSSLHVKPHPRPHSSPPYSIETRSGIKERVFKNRVHPGDGQTSGNTTPVDDGYHGDSVMMLSGDRDEGFGGESCTDDFTDENENVYNTRIFFPVSEMLNSSRENLLQGEMTGKSDPTVKTFRKTRVTPLQSDCQTPANDEKGQTSSDGDVLLTDLDGLNLNETFDSQDVPTIPRVSVEDYDKTQTSRAYISRSHGFGNVSATGNAVCNKRKKNKEPQIIHVLPKSKSDEIPLLNSSIDDMNLKNMSRSCERFAFVNDGFTVTDDNLNVQCRPRSNSLTNQKLVINYSFDERHRSLTDLPNMATLIMHKHEQASTARPNTKESSKSTSKRPALKKRSQTDHSLYAKAMQSDMDGHTGDGLGGKSHHHLPVPVHLFVFGGQEPNVSSVHKYETRLPVFRCTIVPGKVSASQIQALLH